MGSRRSEAKKVRRVIYPRSFWQAMIDWSHETRLLLCVLYTYEQAKHFLIFNLRVLIVVVGFDVWMYHVPLQEKKCIIHGCCETILLCCCLGTLCSRRQTAFCFHNCSFLVLFSYVLYYTQDILSLYFFLFSFPVSSHNMCETFVHFHANILVYIHIHTT